MLVAALMLMMMMVSGWLMVVFGKIPTADTQITNKKERKKWEKIRKKYLQDLFITPNSEREGEREKKRKKLLFASMNRFTSEIQE